MWIWDFFSISVTGNFQPFRFSDIDSTPCLLPCHPVILVRHGLDFLSYFLAPLYYILIDLFMSVFHFIILFSARCDGKLKLISCSFHWNYFIFLVLFGSFSNLFGLPFELLVLSMYLILLFLWQFANSNTLSLLRSASIICSCCWGLVLMPYSILIFVF